MFVSSVFSLGSSQMQGKGKQNFWCCLWTGTMCLSKCCWIMSLTNTLSGESLIYFFFPTPHFQTRPHNCGHSAHCPPLSQERYCESDWETHLARGFQWSESGTWLLHCNLWPRWVMGATSEFCYQRDSKSVFAHSYRWRISCLNFQFRLFSPLNMSGQPSFLLHIQDFCVEAFYKEMG